MTFNYTIKYSAGYYLIGHVFVRHLTIIIYINLFNMLIFIVDFK